MCRHPPLPPKGTPGVKIAGGCAYCAELLASGLSDEVLRLCLRGWRIVHSRASAAVSGSIQYQHLRPIEDWNVRDRRAGD
jgi:hypothetical protein